MSQDKSSYREVFKATSIFGGVQVINIIISIVRSKAVALLLGPTGMGIFGLFLSATSLIGGLTGFGLGTSAVRDISMAHSSDDQEHISKVIKIFRRLVWITGFLGMMLTFVFADTLSHYTFGTDKYTVGFRWISLSLLFTQLTSGQNVLMQGMRQLRSLAMANVFGSLGSLLISLPLFYFYKFEGIVPAIIAGAALAMGIEYYFSSKIKTVPVTVSRQETIAVSKKMLKMGVMLSVSGIISVVSSYVIRIYIGKFGSLADVGLYTAGFNVITTYVGMIFTAMSTDYFPRLSSATHDEPAMMTMVNQQADLSLLILGPVLTAMIVFVRLGITVLYTKDFLLIDQMIQWAAIGIFFKAASWAVMFIFLAKGSNRIYFWNELLINVYLTLFSFLFYRYFGLKGLGMAFVLSYFLYFLQAYLFASRLFSFRFSGAFVRIFLVQFVIAVLAFLSVAYLKDFWGYGAGLALFIASGLISLKYLDRRMGVLDVIKNKIRR